MSSQLVEAQRFYLGEVMAFPSLGRAEQCRTSAALQCAGTALFFVMLPMIGAMRPQQHTIAFLLLQCFSRSISDELRLVFGNRREQVHQKRCGLRKVADCKINSGLH